MPSGIVEPSQPNSEKEKQQQQQQSPARTRLVQRLLANTASLPNFVQDLIRTQAHLVAGTEAAAFLVEQAQGPDNQPVLNLKPIAHVREDDSDPQTRAAALNAFGEIIKPCVQQGKDGAIQIDDTNDGGEWQYCLVTLLRTEGAVVAATAVITRARDLERAQKLLTPMQLVAGYFDLFTLRRTVDQTRSVAQSHQHVLQLATAVATAEGFESAAMNLCNELATRTSASRVSIGWVKGESIKLKAISHSEEFDKKQELSVQIIRTMEECLDNDEIVQYEPDGTASDTVTREAQALSRLQGGQSILSLPLRRAGEVVGVMTLEFAPEQKIGPQAATGLAVAADLLAPQLYDRFQNDRWLITKVGLSIQDTAKKTIGPKHMLAKTIIAAVILVLAFVSLYRPMYHVKASFQFITETERQPSAPFDQAYLKKVNFIPGQHFKKGDVLLEFDAIPSRLEYLQYQNQADQAAASAESAQAAQLKDSSKTSDMVHFRYEQQIAQAKADLAKSKVDRAQIIAPYDGQILDGDLRDKIDSPFKQGDPLIKIAPTDALTAKLAVEERDIQELRKDQKGTLATTNRPWDSVGFRIDRIVPQGEIKDSGNVFDVYAIPENVPEKTLSEWRPGMMGEARIDTVPRPLIWIWMHRFVDFVRFKLWL